MSFTLKTEFPEDSNCGGDAEWKERTIKGVEALLVNLEASKDAWCAGRQHADFGREVAGTSMRNILEALIARIRHVLNVWKGEDHVANAVEEVVQAVSGLTEEQRREVQRRVERHYG